MGRGTTSYSILDRPANLNTARVGEAWASVYFSLPLGKICLSYYVQISEGLPTAILDATARKEQGSCAEDLEDMLFQIMQTLEGVLTSRNTDPSR